MKIRRYMKEDVPTLLKLLKAGLPESRYRDIPVSEKDVTDTLVGNAKNILFFCNVIEIDGEIVGLLVASLSRYSFSQHQYASDIVTYILPEHRSLKVVTRLVESYVNWAKERGVAEVYWRQSSAAKTEQFTTLAERLGFTFVGANFAMELKK